METPDVVVVDCGSGNVASVANLCRFIGVPAITTDDPQVVSKAGVVVLPGVGAFDTVARRLREKGLVSALDDAVLERKVPFLGICVGMQILGAGSDEGVESGLNWIGGRCVRFQEGDLGDRRIPHIGWNGVKVRHPSGLIPPDMPNSRFYFVHSYHLVCSDDSVIVATTQYGIEFVSIVRHGNICGVQFHPEKSHKFGAGLLREFLKSSPAV